MFQLEFESSFVESYNKLIKGNKSLEKKFTKTVHHLANDPKHPSLKSHKVDTLLDVDVWSSWITGDIRLIWNYSTTRKSLIVVITLGTHSGSAQIYKKKSS